MKPIIHPSFPWWSAPDRDGLEQFWERMDGLVVWLPPGHDYLVFSAQELGGAGASELEGLIRRLREVGVAQPPYAVEFLNRRRLAGVLRVVDEKHPLDDLIKLASVARAPESKRWPRRIRVPF